MTSDIEHTDVAIIGGGPAGLAAGVFTARYGLQTRIFDRGPSRLKQCAYLDNYLGFPAGIDAGDFLQLANNQARRAGCAFTPERVASLECASEGFILHTRSARVTATRVIVASGYNTDFLRPLAVEGLFDAQGALCTDACGRARLPGLYAAGALAGAEDQALVCAGHGARVALALIRDARDAHFRWPPLARHLDWQVREGVYASERWSARVHSHFQDECQPDEDSRSVFRSRVDDWICDKRKQQIARAELARRQSHAARPRRSEAP